VLAALTRPGTTTIIAAVALMLWPNTARVIRSQVLTVRERAFVEAARVTGCSTARILFVHVAPSILPLSFLYGSIAVGWAILTEASASFLGFGDPTVISWGTMLQDAYANQAMGREAYNWFVPPGLCIVLVVLAGFFISRGYEEILFPKLRS
jgi:peptide/nickel transport system permease protein